MHVRWSTLNAMPVVDDDTHEMVGFLSGVHIDPDRGHLLGFFVAMLTGADAGPLFLAIPDIVAVGTKVHIRSLFRLSPPTDLVRLQRSFQESRTFLGQPICIRESGRTVGICSDIQFDTKFFKIEWIFPRRFFFSRQPIAVSEILEVNEEAIWVSEPLRKQKLLVAAESESGGLLVPEVLPS